MSSWTCSWIERNLHPFAILLVLNTFMCIWNVYTEWFIEQDVYSCKHYIDRDLLSLYLVSVSVFVYICYCWILLHMHLTLHSWWGVAGNEVSPKHWWEVGLITSGWWEVDSQNEQEMGDWLLKQMVDGMLAPKADGRLAPKMGARWEIEIPATPPHS